MYCCISVWFTFTSSHFLTYLLKYITDEQLDLAFSAATNDRYEYVGDGVIHMIVTDMLLSYLIDPGMDSGAITKIRGIIESNKLFAYMMNKRGLCTPDKKTASIVGKSYTKNEKRCADIFESIVGLFYVYLRSKYNTYEPLDVIYDWLCDVFYLDKILEGIYYGRDAYLIVDELFIDTPKLEPWTGWSKCDNNRTQTRTRKCISGACEDKVENRYCEGWSNCDETGVKKKWNPVTGSYDYDLCTEKTICDDDGNRKSLNMLTGTWETEICDDSLYDEQSYFDARCTDGNTYLLRKCKDKSKCVNKIIGTLPCNERLVSVEEFKKLNETDKDLYITKGIQALEDNFINVNITGTRVNKYITIMKSLSML